MTKNIVDKIWNRFHLTRRGFLRNFGIASSAITFSPFFIDRFASVLANDATIKVYMVKNGDCFQNTTKIWEMLGGPSKYINSNDVVVIKGNAQWPRQGYTHTGCIKGVINKILEMPGFSGEILICDNVQNNGTIGQYGFDVSEGYYRHHNWPDHNWNSLAGEFQANGKSVATKRWINSVGDINRPADGEGWIRNFFSFYDLDTYFSYPIFESPLMAGRMIDMQKGVWENGAYTGQNVKTIFMPTLNNHGSGSSDYAGVTSAIKSFFGATEIHDSVFRGYSNVHGSSFNRNRADYAGELTAGFINTMYTPILYITGAMWVGHSSRTGDATETKTILACENPATLDYIACRDVISPYASYLEPDQDNNTRQQILGCIRGGVGTINPLEFEVISYDFNNPTVNRVDIDRKINDYKVGNTDESDVKNYINEYMETN